MVSLMFILLFVLMFLGVPIAFCLSLSGAGFLMASQMKPLTLVAQRMMVGMDSFPILAITLFICTGYLMESTSMSRRLVNCIKSYFGHMSGNVGIITVIACTIFAALTGSGPATVAAIGSVMLPSLLDAGYTKEHAAGLLAASGALGPIIPPSVIMIVYGATMEVSITDMFTGSIIPGLMLAAMLVVMNRILIKRQKIDMKGRRYTAKERLVATKEAIPTLLLPVIILGGIYGGIFTPTEAASTSVVYALILGFVNKEINFKTLLHIFRRTVETSATVILVVGFSSVFSWLVTATRVPNIVSEAIMTTITNKYVYLVALTLLLFIAGTLLDGLVNVVILAPIVVPAGIALGVDPLHMGVLFCICLVAGFVTPPFGINLFTAASTTGIPYGNVLKGVLPYMITLLVGALIIVFWPGIVLLLPGA